MARHNWRTLWLIIVGAVAFRYVCFAVMTVLAIWNEARAAPHLPDLVIDHVPYVPIVHQINYLVWLLTELTGAILLLVRVPRWFVRYTISAGILSLVRGVCIVLTGLGPVRGADVHAGMTWPQQWSAILQILNPFDVFLADAANEILTKDLFFSGHVSGTFLLLLYAWSFRRWRWWLLGLHILVVVSVFLAHLHYAIDVVAAYPFALMIFVIREGYPGRRACSEQGG